MYSIDKKALDVRAYDLIQNGLAVHMILHNVTG